VSTDFSIKPVGAPVATPIVQPASEAADNAVATELPASKSVAVADASARVRNDLATASAFESHQVFVDRASALVVFQVLDDRTNLVVRQFPDEAVLRRRAYFRTLDLAKDGPTRLVVTDRRA
jgi:uncharacterized FlaG/YvyC family protein